MIEISYLLYLAISIAITIWVARTLSKNGRVFLVDSFDGREVLADSVNHLLVVGFYMLNLGYILMTLQSDHTFYTIRASIEFLSEKIGFVLLVLGALHFANVYVISNWGSRRQRSMPTERDRADAPGE